MAEAVRPYRVEYEHPAQRIAATFLRALALGEIDLVWERLSRESRGLLEGLYAARHGLALDRASGVGSPDDRLATVVAPLRAAALAASGGADVLNRFGVSAARVVDRLTAFVLLLPDFGEERIVAQEDWRPAHLLAFVYESREWLVDLGATARLSADAGLPDPLGGIGIAERSESPAGPEGSRGRR